MQPVCDVRTGCGAWTGSSSFGAVAGILSNSYLHYQQEQICRFSREKKNDLKQQAANNFHERGREILQGQSIASL